MDGDTLVPFPIDSDVSLDLDLREIDAAIALVARGHAIRVRLVGLMRPDAAAEIGLAHAQGARVSFQLERHGDGGTTVTVGPRN